MPVSTNVRSRYELREVLSKGGMGVVYRAWDTLMKRDVALKTILDVQSRAAFDLFYKEWGLQASIIHPNIIEIYDIGEFEDNGTARPYFVMPLLPGCSLAELIRNDSRRLTVERSVDIMNQVCRGLQAAHERGLIHRDIKPSNVFVMADDSVKIIDFGIAFTEAGSTHTAMRGTLPYMAPELLQLKPPSVLTDIFALGAVAYEALTRRRAFEGKTDSEISEAVLHSSPPPACEVNPSVGHVLSQVVHKALAKQPWHRYSSAREFGDTLQRAVHNEPIAFFDKSRVTPRVERASRAYERGEYQFATEILDELDGEGYIDPEISMLRNQVGQAGRQVSIRQILESARRFFEEEEYSLALRKIDEALRLDPEHPEALELRSQVERNRRARQVEEWSQLAVQHLNHNAFGEARAALSSLLELQPGDGKAREMLAEVDRRAGDFETRRLEKSRIYDEAVRAWEKGEVTAALGRLDRWASLGQELPETDAARELSCQNFYNQVRSEDEALRDSLDRARQLLAEQNFAAALEICDHYLAKYPNQPLFQALRFDVEERRRKNLSAFIAETDRRVESEPDPEKRCAILEEAARLYPGEGHFERALRLARDKRNLVSSVVEKARLQEEQGRYGEAVDTWEMLRAIHSQYPGLDNEVARAQKRRQAASRSEARSAWVERIDKLLELREFEKAADASEKALAEFPNDAEMLELEKLACKRIATSSEVERMLEAGRAACVAGNHAEGLKLMRDALELDPGDPVLRATLVDALTERARELGAGSTSGSEALIEEVLQLDPGNSFALSLRREHADAQRSEFVYWCAAQARRLQAAGDLDGARAVVQEGLAQWPQEASLLQLAAKLQREADATKRPSPAPSTARPVSVMPSAVQTPPDSAAPPAPEAGDISQVRYADTAAAFSLPSAETPAAPAEAVFPATAPQAVVSPPVTQASSATPVPPVERRQMAMWQWVALAVIGVLALAFAAQYIARVTPRKPSAPAAAVTVPFSVSTTPPGARVIVDGKDRGVSGVNLELPVGVHSVETALEGYETASRQVSLAAHSPFALQIPLIPLPASLRVTTDADTPDVRLDDQALGGAAPDFASDSVAAGHHRIVLNSRQGQATIEFDAAPATVPVIAGALQAKNINAVVLGQFGTHARLYSSEPLQVSLDNGAPVTATAGGIDLPALTAGGHSLSIGEGAAQRSLAFQSGAAPSLTAFVEQKAAPETGGVLVTAGVDGATVFVNGKAYRRQTKNGQIRIGNLKPGDYSIRVARDGFESPAEQKVSVKKGEDARLQFQLRPVVRMATLRVQGAPAGAQVLIDENPSGVIQSDGTFNAPVSPGAHAVALRNGRAQSRPIQRQFVAGQTMQFSGGELALQLPQGVLRVHVSPAGAHVTIRGEAEHESAARAVTQESLTLPEGTYVVSATAADYNPSAKTVTVSSGAPATVDMTLAAKAKKPAAVTGMNRWDDSKGWTQEGEWQIHKGGNFLSFQSEEIDGRLEFNALVRKGKRLEWFLARRDDRNYLLFRLDKKNLVVEQMADGKSREIAKTPLSFDHDQPVAVRIEVSAGAVNTSFRQGPGGWTSTTPLTNPAGNFDKGRFGLHIGGRDEIGINSFTYYPK